MELSSFWTYTEQHIKTGEKEEKRTPKGRNGNTERTERGEKRPMVVEELFKDQRGTSSVSRE